MTEDTNKEPEKTGIIRDKEGKFVEGISGNPDGRPKGTLSLVGMLKDALREMIKERGTGEMKERAKALIEIYLKKAIIEEDARIIIDMINRIDGLPKQNLQLGVDEIIGEVNISIKKNEESKSTGDNNLPEDVGGIPDEETQTDHLGGRNGERKNDSIGPTDGDDNAEGKEEADNDSKKVSPGPESDSDAGLPKCAEGTGGI